MRMIIVTGMIMFMGKTRIPPLKNYYRILIQESSWIRRLLTVEFRPKGGRYGEYQELQDDKRTGFNL